MEDFLESTEEIWNLIPGFEGYKASSLGQIGTTRKTGIWHLLNPGIARTGYRKSTIFSLNPSKAHTIYVHVLVCLAFHGPRPEGMQVRHLDGDKLNNAASNLAWGTALENMADKKRHGTNYEANKTHCPSGHAYSPENTYWSRGWRHCRTCVLKSQEKAREHIDRAALSEYHREYNQRPEVQARRKALRATPEFKQHYQEWYRDYTARRKAKGPDVETEPRPNPRLSDPTLDG